jgi:hypothetical protein
MTLFTIVPVAPLRAEPSHRSEMVSQLLFGETCQLLERSGDYVMVKCHYDGYQGWCQLSQLTAGEEPKPDAEPGYVAAFTSEILINGESCMIPHAAVLDNRALPAINWGPYEILVLDNNLQVPSVADDKAFLIQSFAFRYLNVPYLWGGKSVFGTDCSGFVQQVFKLAGIWLPRDSGDQAEEGETVEFVQAARLGDLAFFDNEEGRIIHVGIMLNEHSIIHSSGYVHVDKIDHAGIIHHVSGARTHQLRIIKRYF